MKKMSGHSPEILDSSEKLGKKNPQPKKGKGNENALNLSVHEEFEIICLARSSGSRNNLLPPPSRST